MLLPVTSITPGAVTAGRNPSTPRTGGDAGPASPPQTLLEQALNGLPAGASALHFAAPRPTPDLTARQQAQKRLREARNQWRKDVKKTNVSNPKLSLKRDLKYPEKKAQRLARAARCIGLDGRPYQGADGVDTARYERDCKERSAMQYTEDGLTHPFRVRQADGSLRGDAKGYVRRLDEIRAAAVVDARGRRPYYDAQKQEADVARFRRDRLAGLARRRADLLQATLPPQPPEHAPPL